MVVFLADEINGLVERDSMLTMAGNRLELLIGFAKLWGKYVNGKTAGRKWSIHLHIACSLCGDLPSVKMTDPILLLLSDPSAASVLRRLFYIDQ